MIAARCLAAALLLVPAHLSGLGGPREGAAGDGVPQSGASEQGGSKDSPPAPSAAEAGARFASCLASFRQGTADATTLERAARAFEQATGRADAARIVRFYGALSAEERAHGFALEQRFDALRAEATRYGVDAPRLTAFLVDAQSAADVVPAAHAQSLLARLLARAMEDGAEPAARSPEVRALAVDAVARFERAGMVTPTLEPLWALARVALQSGQRAEAERRFEELSLRAEETQRPAWRERGIVGAIGCARDRGALFRVDALLKDLASFRSPDSCWALAREAAVQLLTRDDASAAARWLAAHPPVGFDPEVDLDAARLEWRALAAAAALRAGDTDRADGLARDLTGELGALLRAAVALEKGLPQEALRELDAADSSSIDALALRGRALLRSGRGDDAIAVLEEAQERARQRDETSRRSGTLADASATGEWLGLSALEALAYARGTRDGALAAAVAVEASLSRTDETACEARLRLLAASAEHGLVLWLVAADRTLGVHVARDGSASLERLELGRRDLGRAGRRLRDAARATRSGPWGADESALAEGVARELFPSALVESLEASPKGGLVILARGASEEIPFELLTLGGPPLGLRHGLMIAGPPAAAPAAANPAAASAAGAMRWTALGAPALEGTPFAPLPGAEAELVRLARVHPHRTVLRIGEDASRQALVEALLGPSPLHVATHVVDRRESRSGIRERGLVLSGGDVFTAADIAALRPRLPLVVLAACGSADGAQLDGVGPRGVAQAFLESGTRAAIVTQWSVSDAATPLGMLCLHAALVGGASPAEAARRARVALHRAGAPAAEWAALRALGHP